MYLKMIHPFCHSATTMSWNMLLIILLYFLILPPRDTSPLKTGRWDEEHKARTQVPKMIPSGHLYKFLCGMCILQVRKEKPAVQTLLFFFFFFTLYVFSSLDSQGSLVVNNAHLALSRVANIPFCCKICFFCYHSNIRSFGSCPAKLFSKYWIIRKKQQEIKFFGMKYLVSFVGMKFSEQCLQSPAITILLLRSSS